MASPPALPLSATAATAPAPTRGMGFDSLPPLSTSPTVFGFLKSLNLRIIGKDLGDVPAVFGWDLVLYEPSEVQTGSEGGSFVDLTEEVDEPFFNFDPIGEFVDGNSDESDSIVEVLQPTSLQQPKPAEWGPRCQFKATVSRTVPSPVRRTRTCSSGSPSILPLPIEVVKPSSKNPSSKKPSSKSSKKSTRSPPQRTKKTSKRKRHPNRLRRWCLNRC